jgi:V8-like Glu-specific endopeptidase
MLYITKTASLLATIAALNACGDHNSPASKPMIIVGSNDLTTVTNSADLPERYAAAQKSIGLMTGKCTAFHLGNGIVATAGHCVSVDTPRTDAPASAVPCQYVDIQWGKTATEKPYLTSRCMEVLEHVENDKTDIAILRVDPVPPSKLEIAPGKAFVGSSLSLLGYANGTDLKYSQGCGMYTPHEDTVTKGQFTHQCDSEPGHSGSPILDSNSMQVVGVHDGGDREWNYGTFLSYEKIKMLQQQANPSALDIAAQEGLALNFGPFENNQNKLLATIPSTQASAVSLAFDLDIEQDYDVLRIVDGLGNVRQITGSLHEEFKSLKTPVSIAYVSDYAGPSKSISVEITAVE